MKKLLTLLLAAVLIFSTAVVFVGCDEKTGTADNASATSETSSSGDALVEDISSTEISEPSASGNPSGVGDPEDDEQGKSVDAFLEKIADDVGEIEYSHAGGFYQKKFEEEFVEVEPTAEKGVFDLKIFDDYSNDCPLTFTLKSDAGTFITEEGDTNIISGSAGETFIWKAAEIGKLVLENSDKPYNTLYTGYFRNGAFKSGYVEYQYIDIIAGYDGKIIGYGSFSFYLAVTDNVIRYELSRFLFLPEIDGEYQQVDEGKFAKAQYTARVLPESIYTERLQSEFFYCGTGILLYPPKNTDDGFWIFLNADVRDRLFEKEITLEDLCIDPADFGLAEDKLFVGGTYTSYVGYDGVDGGYLQLQIKRFSYTHEEIRIILSRLYEYLWTLDFIDYVSYIEAGSMD